MLLAYIQAALERAHYEIIEDDEPFYGEVPELPGVWATGDTLEACRRHLAAAIEDWLLFSIARSLPIPALGDAEIRLEESALDQLGPAKVVRIWSALQVGKGDYLRFRETHFAGEDVASLAAKIKAFEANEQTPDTVGTE
jgi:predicted RNase H-like HicB family nuclease